MLRANVFDDVCEYDGSDPADYRSAVATVGKAVCGKTLAVKVFELPPGENLWPVPLSQPPASNRSQAKSCRAAAVLHPCP
jgi:hypothetical protein